ncbi:MAG: GNAT family N-acetyltransferase [Myxococcales bacterium]|nr:GNAT family N-acetyltransferase [Myxococcales bacterium]
MQVEIRQLSECPEHLTTVGTWLWEQWWHRRTPTPALVIDLLRTRAAFDRVPYTVVGLADGVPVGTCSVIENDCDHRPQYTPWVAAVYVVQSHRKRGVASAILQEAARIASRAGVTGLYIDCLAVTAPVYERNGWTILESEVGDKDSVVMLRRLTE